MESLKPSLLLLFLLYLGSTEGQSCHGKKTDLTIQSGNFDAAGDNAPLVVIEVEYNGQTAPLKTRAVRGLTPSWSEALPMAPGPHWFTLYVKFNNDRRMYVCSVSAKKGAGKCEKYRGNRRLLINYSVSC